MSELDDIERDIEESRARLELTIGELQRKLSPIGLAGEAVDLAGSAPRPGELAERITDIAKRNPLPTLLIGAGIGWLAYEALRARTANRGSPVHRGDEIIDEPEQTDLSAPDIQKSHTHDTGLRN